MKIIVTGGAGFIGSHIVDAYVKNGHKVAVIDNLATGFRKNVNPKARFYKADVRNLKLIESIFRRERPEVVNHHAAIAEVVKSLRNPIPTLEVNVLGTTNTLLGLGKYCKGKNKKFIFSSSGGTIYGQPKKFPVSETAPLGALSPYGLSKLLGEEAIKFYANYYGFAYTIFRYPNVYGPRQNPKGEAGVVAIFGGLMKNGNRPTIFGDGSKSRDYVYVGDIVSANFKALSQGNYEIMNLGHGKSITDQQIFDAVAKVSRFDGKPIYAPFRDGEVQRSALNAKKAKKILGWRPKVKLENGIKKALESI